MKTEVPLNILKINEMKLIFKSCQKITTEKTSCVDRTTEKGGISGAHPFFQIVYMIHDKLSSFSERMYGT